jgi:DNA-binding NarL/FixJ family response regulator
MPEYDGFDLLCLIKRHLCPGTPVIVFTSSDDGHDITRARELGAAGYFSKAVSPNTLPDKIERILTCRDVAWIDDYHCVIDPRATPLDQLPLTPTPQRVANGRPEGESAFSRPQRRPSAARSRRGARAPRLAIVR